MFGKGGQVLGRIGRQARGGLKLIIGTRVYLDLRLMRSGSAIQDLERLGSEGSHITVNAVRLD